MKISMDRSQDESQEKNIKMFPAKNIFKHKLSTALTAVFNGWNDKRGVENFRS